LIPAGFSGPLAAGAASPRVWSGSISGGARRAGFFYPTNNRQQRQQSGRI
jgi:hypothetical protein